MVGGLQKVNMHVTNCTSTHKTGDLATISSALDISASVPFMNPQRRRFNSGVGIEMTHLGAREDDTLGMKWWCYDCTLYHHVLYQTRDHRSVEKHALL